MIIASVMGEGNLYFNFFFPLLFPSGGSEETGSFRLRRKQ